MLSGFGDIFIDSDLSDVYFQAIMKLEDLERLTNAELRQKAMESFADADNIEQLVGTILLPKARFYLDEIERRQNARISRRDFRMELIVIALIGLELITAVDLAIWGGRQQDREVKAQLAALGSVQGILSNLQNSSEATAATLVQLKSVTDTMNGALQKQVELFYDVQINVVYNQSTKKLVIINNGRSNITIWSQRIGEDSDPVLNYPKPDLIAPAGTYEIALEGSMNKIAATLPKGQMHQYSFAFHVKNEKEERFTLNGYLIARWDGDVVSFNIPIITVVPGWNKK